MWQSVGRMAPMIENGAIVESESRQDAAPTVLLLAPWKRLPAAISQKITID
jgi:hypothetical protein